LDTDKYTDEDHGKKKAEIRGMLPQAKECQRLLANRQTPVERRGKESPPQPVEGTPVNTLILDFWPARQRDNSFLMVKPLRWWYFVMAALAK